MHPVGQAWQSYRQGIERVRARLLALGAAAGEDGAERAHRLLLEAEAAAYNLVIAPDPRRPRLLLHSVFAPGLYDWLLPNPDFVYRYAFCDGRGTYRLSGTRGSALFLDVQTIAGFFGDPALKLLDSHALDGFARPDGTLDILLSARAPDDGGAWIPLARDAVNTVIVREAFDDWTGATGAALRLDVVHPAPAAAAARSFADRLAAALRMIEFCIGTFGPEFCASVVARVGENRFLHVDTDRDEDASNPGVAYLPAAYRLEPDEALIVAFDLPHARYWGLHLADRWSRTADYLDRQTSLNGHQARIGADGRVHVVLACSDPGVANWLDTSADAAGMMLLRWYGADRAPVPQITRVPLAGLPDALPPDIIGIAPHERAEILARRRRAVIARYDA